MHARTLMLALLLPALFTAPSEAQERRFEVRREGPRVWVNGEEVTGDLREFMQRRARLGVTVNLEPSDTDSIGAAILAVTPGGPAAKAGLRSGDVITRLDGQTVVSRGERGRDGESQPGARLVELAAKLAPNTTVTVEYLRSGRRATAQLVTGDEPVFEIGPNSFAFRFPGGEQRDWSFPELRVERFGPGMGQLGEEGPGRFEIRRLVGGGPLGELELASINPDLASYFGVTEGVLVLNAPVRSALPLKGGDVILSIGGRRPTSPASLMRILRSYEPNETITMEIMRLKKRETISGKLQQR